MGYSLKSNMTGLNKDKLFLQKVLFFSLLHRRIRYEWELGFNAKCRLQMERGNEEEGVHNTARCREQAEATADSSR